MPAIEGSDSVKDALVGDLSGNGFGCAPHERIWAAALGELPEAEVSALLAHSTSCGACAAAWRVAGEMSLEAKPLPIVRRRPRWAAAAAIAAGILLFVLVKPKSVEPTWRGGNTAQIQSLLGNDPQPRASLTLRWSGPAKARYSVMLATKDLRQLFRAGGLEQPEAPVPEAAFKDLAPAAELIWRVEALLPDGSRAESPAFLLKLK
jgi:hypothetical protein